MQLFLAKNSGKQNPFITRVKRLQEWNKVMVQRTYLDYLYLKAAQLTIHDCLFKLFMNQDSTTRVIHLGNVTGSIREAKIR